MENIRDLNVLMLLGLEARRIPIPRKRTLLSISHQQDDIVFAF